MPSVKKLIFTSFFIFAFISGSVLLSFAPFKNIFLDSNNCDALSVAGGSDAGGVTDDGSGTEKDPWGPDTMHSFAEWFNHLYEGSVNGDVIGPDGGMSMGDFQAAYDSITANSQGLTEWTVASGVINGVKFGNDAGGTVTLTIPSLPGPVKVTENPTSDPSTQPVLPVEPKQDIPKEADKETKQLLPTQTGAAAIDATAKSLMPAVNKLDAVKDVSATEKTDQSASPSLIVKQDATARDDTGDGVSATKTAAAGDAAKPGTALVGGATQDGQKQTETVGAGATKINSMMPADAGSDTGKSSARVGSDASMMPADTGKSTALVGSDANQDSSKQVAAIGTGKDAKATDALAQTLQQVDSNGKPVAQSAVAAASNSQTTSNAQTTALATSQTGSAAAGASLQPINVSNQSSKQIAQLGSSTKPNVILLGEQTKPATVQLGEQTKPATAQLGESSKPATVQLGETSKPATVQLGEQTKPATVQLGETSKPAMVYLGNSAAPAAVFVGSSVTSAPVASPNNSLAPAVTTAAPHYSASNPEVSGTVATNSNNNSVNNNPAPAANQSDFNSGSSGAPVAASAPASPLATTQSPSSASAVAQTAQTTQTAQAVQTPSGGVNAVPNIVSNTLGVKESADSNDPTQSPVDSQARINAVKNGTRYTATLKTDEANHVDFYIYGQSLSALTYLGIGTFNSGSGLWEFVFDSTPFPNGGYELFALISKTGGSFVSPRFGFTINNAVAVNIQQQSDLKSQLVQAQQTISVAFQTAQTSSTGKTISAAIPQDVTNSAAFQSNIADFTAAVGSIKQLNNSLRQAEAENSKIVDQIAQLEKKLAVLSPKTFDSLRNDMVAELNELIKQKLLLDASIVSIQGQVKAAQDKLDRAEAAVLNLVPPAQKAAVQNQLTGLEQSIGAGAQQAINAQNELDKDSDQDGVSDYDELFTYHTDPFNPDTDGDGFLDGDEVAHGFDPLNPNDHKTIAYRDPRTVSPLRTDVYTVDSVSSLPGPGGQLNIKLTGHGLANSYVDLFIYSQPLVVEVKTDSQGRWEYILGKPLNDGLHTVYAAQVDSVGEIEARSQEFVFLKAGAKVSSVTEDTSMPQTTI